VPIEKAPRHHVLCIDIALSQSNITAPVVCTPTLREKINDSSYTTFKDTFDLDHKFSYHPGSLPLPSLVVDLEWSEYKPLRCLWLGGTLQLHACHQFVIINY